MFELKNVMPASVESALAILNDSLQKKRMYGDDAWGDGEFTASELAENIDNKTLFMGYESDTPVAVMILEQSDENMWDSTGLDGRALYIHRLSTPRKYSGKGLGAQMIKVAEDKAQSMGKVFMRLDCSALNKGLCAYYERLGFRRVNADENLALYEKPVAVK
jgi:GNAT superfamily N-acetyltransferase